MGKSAIILAAGFGTRMKSSLHKVLHPVCDKPMILHIFDELEKLDFDEILVVVGQQREAVEAVIGKRAKTVYQIEQLGTGDAVKAALPSLSASSGVTLVLYGDAPLIRAQTMEQLVKLQEESNASVVVLCADVPNPYGLGRVFRTESGEVLRIVEEKDATPEERLQTLINTGIYAYKSEDLRASVAQIRPDNTQNEYYLTDTLALLGQTGKRVLSLQVEDYEEVASVNDRVQLAEVERICRQRVLTHWMQEGVTIQDPQSTYIGTEVVLGRDVVLLPGTILSGHTSIAENAIIGPSTRIVDSAIMAGAVVENAVVLESQVGSQAHVGPFAYLRPGTRVGARAKVGDFVELKNTSLGDDSKVSHLAYLGDAEIGARVNIGCGVITVNYDGKQKFKTTVGDDSFIGSNANLIAPITVGEGAYVCAGSTITDDVPEDGFVIARARQVTKANYVSRWKSNRAMD